MNKKLIVLFSASGMALALAGCNTTQERVGGAGVGVVAGAAVGGPVGAVAGGVVGAATGPTVARRTGMSRRTVHHRTKKRVRTRPAAEAM